MLVYTHTIRLHSTNLIHFQGASKKLRENSIKMECIENRNFITQNFMDKNLRLFYAPKFK